MRQGGRLYSQGGRKWQLRRPGPSPGPLRALLVTAHLLPLLVGEPVAHGLFELIIGEDAASTQAVTAIVAHDNIYVGRGRPTASSSTWPVLGSVCTSVTSMRVSVSEVMRCMSFGGKESQGAQFSIKIRNEGIIRIAQGLGRQFLDRDLLQARKDGLELR